MTKSIQLKDNIHKEVMMLKVSKGFISCNRVIEVLLKFWRLKHEDSQINTEKIDINKQEESISK